MWRAVVLGLAALAPAGIAADAAAPVRPHGVVADCSRSSYADFPEAFTSPRNLVVGPLVMTGARGDAGWASVFPGNKFPLLVRNGHRVTLELSTRMRRVAGLAYGPLPQGELRLREMHRVVTFVACTGASGSTADGKPVTFWAGGIVTLAPRCVPLRIWIDSRPSPRRAVIRMGVDRCS
jgi:hypothetical protein